MDGARHQRLSRICYAIVIVGILNFIAFGALATYLGGDAVNGKVEDRHYYLSGVRNSAGSKVRTEVNKGIFEYSRWHAYSVLASWPFVMGASIADKRMKKREG